MDINVPTQRCSFFFFYYYSIESSSQTCKSSALLSRSTNLKSDKIIKSFELIKFPRSENGVRIRCFSRQLRQLLRTSVVDPLLTAVNLQSQCEIECFFFPSLSLSRARRFHEEYKRDVAREEGWVGAWRARKRSGNGSPWNCRLILLAPVIPPSLRLSLPLSLFWHRGTEVPSLRALLATRVDPDRGKKQRLSETEVFMNFRHRDDQCRPFHFLFSLLDASAGIQWWKHSG